MFWSSSKGKTRARFSAPRMPCELERYIVEMYALECAGPERILQLLPVCHRVRVWLEPALYRTLIFNDGSDEERLPTCEIDVIDRLSTAYPGALQNIVKNIMLIGERRDTVERVLRSCNAAENVFLAGCATRGLDLSLISPSLRHLHCTAETLELLNWKPEGYTFPALTHLELFNIDSHSHGRVPQTLLRLLSRKHFPYLAHLAISATSVIRYLPEVIPHLQNLESIVIVSAYRIVSSTPLPESDRRILMGDQRLVLVSVPDYVEDWQDGVLTANDFWARAARRIANRLSGAVDANHYAVNFDDME
ncbi:unnamed protein product [Mycena citricolor]|uniref:Uncharacterized protein n=1 Tax=Mycena citricolor TaxID=2018698 RepID=A0AAD2K0R2_9AGAR|nr:unnamed protein product [Mycena citricolor]